MMKNTIGAVSLMITTLVGTMIYTQNAYSYDANAVMATYSDKKLTEADLDSAALEIFDGKLPEGKQHVSELPPQMQEFIVRNIVISQLLDQAVQQQHIEDTPQFKKQLERAKQQIAQRELLKAALDKEITEKALKQRYAKFTKEFGKRQELHVEHILVDSEDKAKEALAEIKSGKNFEDVAKERSLDSSKAQGGDLGYVQKEQLVKPFADAAFALKDGEISSPVKSDFGWHVIKAIDRRDVKAPDFDQVKPQLEQQMTQELVDAYIEKMLKNAKFKLNIPGADKK